MTLTPYLVVKRPRISTIGIQLPGTIRRRSVADQVMLRHAPMALEMTSDAATPPAHATTATGWRVKTETTP